MRRRVTMTTPQMQIALSRAWRWHTVCCCSAETSSGSHGSIHRTTAVAYDPDPVRGLDRRVRPDPPDPRQPARYPAAAGSAKGGGRKTEGRVRLRQAVIRPYLAWLGRRSAGQSRHFGVHRVARDRRITERARQHFRPRYPGCITAPSELEPAAPDPTLEQWQTGRSEIAQWMLSDPDLAGLAERLEALRLACDAVGDPDRDQGVSAALEALAAVISDIVARDAELVELVELSLDAWAAANPGALQIRLTPSTG